MSDPLLMLNVHVEISQQHDGPFCADALPAAGELAALHVALHDVDAVLLVERNS
jgi:hypothetical protein